MPDADTALVTARLHEAATGRQPLELIIVLRGTVRAGGSGIPGRWRVHVPGQGTFTFPAAAVVAATPIVPK